MAVIRVMVTDWNPLTIWLYKDCYLRFSCVPFTLEKIDDLFVHLCNNSIQKYSEQFEASEISGNMWTSQQFSDLLLYASMLCGFGLMERCCYCKEMRSETVAGVVLWDPDGVGLRDGQRKWSSL